MGIESSTGNPGEVELRRREGTIRVPVAFLFCREGEPTGPSAEGDDESLLVFDPHGSRIEEEARSAIRCSRIPKEDLNAIITHVSLHQSHDIPQGLIDID